MSVIQHRNLPKASVDLNLWELRLIKSALKTRSSSYRKKLLKAEDDSTLSWITYRIELVHATLALVDHAIAQLPEEEPTSERARERMGRE